jgi:Ser/Thr protein kinase RdoA (MazF antagonist)
MDFVHGLFENRYGLGIVQSVVPINSGPKSLAWRVDVSTPDRKRSSYCLKAHKMRTIDALKHEHSIVRSFQAAGFFLIPRVVADHSGGTIADLNGVLYAVYDFVDSDCVFDWTEGAGSAQHSYLAGSALAEFHHYGKLAASSLGLAMDRQLPWTSGEFDPVLVHGDYHPANVLFKNDQVAAIVDLDYCRMANPAFDVAYAMALFGMNIPTARFDVEKCEQVLAGYNENTLSSPLSPKLVKPLIGESVTLVIGWLDEQIAAPGGDSSDLNRLRDNTIAILSGLPD